MKKIYLAGPLFSLAERTFNTQLANLLSRKGYEVWVPQEKEPRQLTADNIFNMDKDGILWCDVVVANMDGTDPDSGTAWECGFAHGIGKPVLTFRTDFRSADEVGGARYNIMLWSSADWKVNLNILAGGTIQELARNIDASLLYRNGKIMLDK